MYLVETENSKLVSVFVQAFEDPEVAAVDYVKAYFAQQVGDFGVAFVLDQFSRKFKHNFNDSLKKCTNRQLFKS